MGTVQALATLIFACSGQADTKGLVDEAALVVDDPAKLDAVLARASDDAEHDMLVEVLAVRYHAKAAQLCPRMRTPEGKKQCKLVLDRPHLAGQPK